MHNTHPRLNEKIDRSALLFICTTARDKSHENWFWVGGKRLVHKRDTHTCVILSLERL